METTVAVSDILTVYALVGMVLQLFRNATDKFLLRSAFILLLLPIVQYAVFWGINLASPPEPAASSVSGPRFFDQLINTYQNGTLFEIIGNNMGGLVVGRYPDLLFTGKFFRVLAMFLIGFYISKNMLYTNVMANRPFIRSVMIWGAVIGIPCNIVLAMMMTTDAYYDLAPMGIIQPMVYAFGVLALCLCYASIFTLLYENPAWKKWLTLFAPVGQLALSNYLIQSPICVFIFISYGLGFVARVGPARLTLIALAIYKSQVIFSHIWVRHFRFGPMEWLWRSLTYKKWQPFRKSAVEI